MKILRVLILITLICGFNLIIKAQADCRYGLKFSVRDEAGKIVENAKLELSGLDDKSNLPSYVRLIWIDNAYLFTSHAGQTVNGNFQVKISTDGFETYQQKVNFPVCKIQKFDIQLRPLTNKQNNAILTGTIQDFLGAVIPNGKIKAVDDKGKTFSTNTNDDGVYKLELPEGAYKIEITFSIYNKFTVSDYWITNKMQLDVALQCKNDCKIVGDPIITSEKPE